MTFTPETIHVFLSCKHTMQVDRRLPIGYELLCRRCRRLSKIETTPNYVVDCLGGKGRSCPVGREFGTLESSAVQYAVRHRMRYPHHITLVRNGRSVVHRFGKSTDEGDTLFDVPESKSKVVYSAESGFTQRDDPCPF